MVAILSISDSDKHFESAIQEYEKRLGRLIKIQNIKPFRATNNKIVIKRDTENIISIVQKKQF